MGRSIDLDDPLTLAIAPPADETPEARALRLQLEDEARRTNDEIDEMLRQERAALRKRKKPVKVLLLGQSESGKSTTLKSVSLIFFLSHIIHTLITLLKDFQLTYARKAWQDERQSWRAIIQLNLVRSVTTILDLLHTELTGAPLPASSPFALAALTADADDPTAFAQDAADVGGQEKMPRLSFTEKHKLLKLKLAPLRKVQADLEKRLGSGAEEPTPFEGGSGTNTTAAPFDQSPYSNGYAAPSSPTRRQEFYVRSSTGWKSALEKLRPARPSTSSSRDSMEGARGRREAEETSQIIAGCREDMKALWEDKTVREMLARRKVRLEEGGGL